MTPWEWSMLIAVTAPLGGCLAGLLWSGKRPVQGAAAFFLLGGVAAFFASCFGLISTETFALPTGVFFEVTLAFDKFSAMFLLPFSLIISAVSFEAMRGGEDDASRPRLLARVFASAGVILGFFGVLVTTNVLSLAASLGVILASVVVLAQSESLSSPSIIRWFARRFVGVVALISGLFVLSSGALFNDYATISYIAEQLESGRLIAAWALFIISLVFLADLWPIRSMCVRFAQEIKSPTSRALVTGVTTILPIYIFLRVLLFILPSLTLWFILPVGCLGALTLLRSMHCRSREKLQESTQSFLLGIVTLFLSTAAAFQALQLYDQMNVALFATLIAMIGGSLLLVAHEANREVCVTDRWKHILEHFAIHGMFPSFIFVSVWMMLSVTITSMPLASPIVASLLTIESLLAIAAITWRARIYLQSSRTHLLELRGQKCEKTCQRFGSWLLIAFSVVGTLWLPWGLDQIGATPLTTLPDAWNAGFVSGDATMSFGVLILVIAIVTLLVWASRNRTVTDRLEVELTHDADEKCLEVRAHRFLDLCRNGLRFVRSRILAPTMALYTKMRTWHDARAQKFFSPYIALLLIVLILTLVIAL